ncbi:GNAT family N-acetyltransferase [Virgibacillus siamensis]|uniref:GNAT family N-acetyltransferase n=1 Tax=Virgibacillus siamensis TaxID=480071 RepID=UPI00098543D3|nr:GNAT family N-acetyltransferase [Virgibacillus siamensis]
MNNTTTPLYMMHNLDYNFTPILPSGYHFRRFSHKDDDKKWAKIMTETKEFSSERRAIERFNKELLPHITEAKRRIIFIETVDGNTVGTATAWFGKWTNNTIGRLHWIEIIPDYQGRKLGRPLIIKAMDILKENHQSAYLKTQASSKAAIHLYKELGWYPVIKTDKDRKIWKHLG